MKQIQEPIPGTENRVFMYLEPWNRVIKIPGNWQAYLTVFRLYFLIAGSGFPENLSFGNILFKCHDSDAYLWGIFS